jgi:hypothetical protein
MQKDGIHRLMEESIMMAPKTSKSQVGAVFFAVVGEIVTMSFYGSDTKSCERKYY